MLWLGILFIVLIVVVLFFNRCYSSEMNFISGMVILMTFVLTAFVGIMTCKYISIAVGIALGVALMILLSSLTSSKRSVKNEYSESK